MLLSDILKEKTVAVWGLGYLGYTTILKLQNSGFNILAYDFEERQLNSLLHGKYPTGSQKVSWSGTGFVPSLDFNKIKVAKSAGEMIKGSPLHIIAIPEDERTASGANIAVKLAGIFGHNFKNFSAKPCFIFESAFIPGHIEKYFIGNLKKYGLNVTKDYCAGALFRTDWSIEAFMGKKNRMPIAGCCAKSLDILRAFCEYMGVMPLEMGGIKEAEVYINSTNVIQAMINDFVRQLAMGYPFINMKKLSNILFENITLDDCV